MTVTETALITGITGQDGSYLAEFLLAKGYEVHGIVRRHAVNLRPNIAHITDQLHLHEGDVLDQESLQDIFRTVSPTEIYNLAAQSHVGTSFSMPDYTLQATGVGALRIFAGTRSACPNARIYQASSSEMFGNTLRSGSLDETSELQPVSPYGVAKVMAHHLAAVYRAQGAFIACGILFNHESSRRGPNFVTRKITQGVAAIRAGRASTIQLGNLAAQRDWGYAPEYVDAMWRMLQQPEPDDFVVATGESNTVWHFFQAAVAAAGLEGDPHNYLDTGSAGEHRPTDIDCLVGDATKARDVLKWQPKTGFRELVRLMVEYDLMAIGD